MALGGRYAAGIELDCEGMADHSADWGKETMRRLLRVAMCRDNAFLSTNKPYETAS